MEAGAVTEGLALSGWPGAGWYGRLPGMKAEPSAYRGFRFPAEIISHVVWLVRCFSLSLREVETILVQQFLSSHQIHNLFQLDRHPTPSITEPPVTVPSRPGVMSPASPMLPDQLCGMSNGGGKFARRPPT